MNLIIFIIAAIVAMFALGALLGAPFLPSRRQTTEHALKMFGLKRGGLLLDLGSGSGSMLVAAARRGLRVIGYEINPLLWIISKLRTARYGDLVDVKLADYWHQDLPDVDGIYVFLIGRYMKRLDEKLKSEIKRPTTVVSYAFKIPGKRVIKQKSGLHLYRYYWNRQTPPNLLEARDTKFLA